MAQKDLKPVRSTDEAKRRGKKGGIASGAARRKKRSLRQRLELLLQTQDMASGMKTADAISTSLIREALSGNVRAYEVIRDTIGEKPTEKIDNNLSGALVITWQQ